ncbi:Transcriptional regulator ATRX-like protein [Frankliniella fusca]|uniref:DNA helicase n=1 Tax=Frankliniella fusca TaxID=407009 RepID=A0AAE1HZX4_9NEOP|nr:Transcriptional regulator ATRX-like protein [Frankliniella fusca]
MHSPQRSLKLERKGRLLYIEVTEEEDKFREKKFSDVNKVLKEDIACSTCGVDLKYNVKEGNDLSYHPYLKVLMCEGCKERYSRCSFPVDEEGDQKCCSWCGREGTLYYCSKCSCAFCKKCIKANFGKEKLKDLVDKELVCYICDPKPLYECRAICYAAIECARSRKRKKIAAQKLKVNEMAEKKRLGIKPGRLGRRRATNSDNADCDIEVIISSDDESNNSDLPLNSQRPVSTQKSAMKLGKLKSHPLEKITKDLVRESSGDLTDSDFEPKNSQRLKPCLLKTGRKSKDSGSDSSRKYKDRAVPNSANMNEVCKEKKSDTVPLPDTPKNPEWMILDSHAEDISCVAMSLHERISSFRTKFVAQNWEQNMLPVAVDRLMSYIKRSVQSLLDVQDGLESLSGSSFNISEQKKNTDVTQRTKNFEKSLCDRVKDKETESEGIESDDVHEPKKLQRCGSTESEGECSNGVGDPPENLLISEPGNDLPSDTEIAKETNDNSVAAIMNSRREGSSDDEDLCLKPSVRPHKKTRFDIRELDVYKSDVKLQGKWTVNIEKLPPAEENRLFESVGSYYDNDADSEDASQSDNSVDNLINLNNLKRKAKGSDEDRNKISKSETDTKKKAVKKQEEKLADFLNRSSGPSDAEVSFEDQPLMRFLDKEKDTNSLNDAKKKLLLQSSDSEDNVPDVNEADEKPKQETSVPKKKKNLESQTSKNGGEDIASSSDNENDSDKKKSAWRKDKLLTGKLSDTDTSEEERRLEKRKEKEKEKEKNSSSEDEIFTPKQRKSFETQKKSEPKTETDSDGDTSDDFVKKKRKVLRKKSSSSSSSESEKEKPKKKRRRIKVANSSSDEDEDDKKKTAENDSPTKGRKKIRHMIKEEELEQGTKEAAKEEEERRERIAARQKLYEEIYDGIQKGFEVLDQLVLDFDEETKEPLVEVDKSLVKKLKPHQAKGVKFMWDACFESLKRIERSKGSGCILAHCMGLGKTFQVVTLVHTLFKHPETLVKNVLVVCPVSTVLNWVNEFSKWLQGLEDGPEIEVFELIRCKQNMDRSYRLREWRAEGGVMIMGYDMYRNLTNPASRRARASHMKTFQECLVDPGPDLVICDEGHLLKNEDTGISKAMTRIKTLRRIILTGTPLQNNLKEYHCMVQFVKPNLLGTRKEFLNRFVNPITNGQYEDSTAHDVKRMKRRAHVLHQTLEGSVQRYDYSVLTPFLPPKEEYVISIRISDVQEKLYRHYLEHYSSRGYQGKGAQLFADFQSLQRIWTHPRVLKMSAERAEQKAEKEDDEDSEGSLRDFIDDGDASDSNTSESSSASSGNDDDVVCLSDDSQKGKKKPEEPKPGRRTRSNKTEEIAEPEPSAPSKSKEWWEAFIEESDLDDLRASPKLQMLFSILKDTEENGEKLLVFSQSLYSLDIIEYFLGKIDEATQSGKGSELVDGHTGSWSPGIDYFRLDGSTPTEQRSIWCNIFNKTTNLRARLFLISTRAGGLGINLVAANRVVIFDASWNPSHDLQSIFRIYRFGQKNPCFIYRFLAQGTMEEKIYERQVTKLSLAGRVVDEHQIERYYKMADLQELYQFTPADRSSYEPPKLPKDHLFAEILKKHATIIVKYHEHDSLLENKEEEELNEEERAAAWDDYEKEKKGPVNQPPQVPGTEALPSLEQVEQLLRTRHPDKSDEQIKIDAALTLKQAMEQPFPGIQGYQSRMNMPSHSRYVYPQPAPNTQPNFLRKL